MAEVEDGKVVSSFLLTVALGFLPCHSSLQLSMGSTTLRQHVDSEEVWRHCFLQCYLERSCGVPYLWRLAMRLPLVPRRGADEPDWQAGILVIGSPLSGKTWLVHRFATGAFPECLDKGPFLGTDLRVATLGLRKLHGFTTGRLRIWEPSGVSRQQALGGYLNAAQMVVVCVDSEEDAAARDAERLLGDVMQSMRPRTILALCGLKADRLTPSQHQRQSVRLGRVASSCHAEFGMCSARTGEGVDEFFCAILAAFLESSSDLPAPEPVLSRLAGTLSNSQLLRTLLRRQGDMTSS